jgi:CDP-diacylglycerol---glycerol-3-phosphate 3-phosphatidyltransferase
MGTLKLNLPTILTLSRIVLIPVFVFTVYLHPVFGAFIFGIASLTDFFDGYLARRSGDITKFGIILDPIADKFLIISALIVLVDMARLPAWIAITIIVREFLVTGLRVVALSKDIVIAAELGGKIKTTMQITAILCLILSNSIFGLDLYDIGLVFIWIALIVSIFSGIQYTILFGKKLK